jgi:flagellar biosynthesis anti-sigma factor FlgM
VEKTEKSPIQPAAPDDRVHRKAPLAETDGNQQPNARGRDRVTLSQSAPELAKSCKILQNLPDTRQEKIDALRQRIASGTYKIESRKIARRLIEECLTANVSIRPGVCASKPCKR